MTVGVLSPPAIAIADANGNASVTFTPSVNQAWIVTRIAVTSTSALIPVAQVLVSGVFECGTNNGNGDTAAGNPLPLGAGQDLVVEWSGCTPAAKCTARLTYERVAPGSY